MLGVVRRTSSTAQAARASLSRGSVTDTRTVRQVTMKTVVRRLPVAKISSGEQHYMYTVYMRAKFSLIRPA